LSAVVVLSFDDEFGGIFQECFIESEHRFRRLWSAVGR
jgi:hypothetical protein